MKNKIGINVIAGLIIVLFLAGIIGVRYLISGQDLGCAFAQDPATCAAIKDVNK